MHTGIDHISPEQYSLLKRAQRKEIHPIHLAEILLQIVRDADILSESEQVHPDWIEIYERNKDALTSFVPPSNTKRVHDFFEKIQPLDRVLSSIDPQKLSISFLLGAGASKPAPSNIPTVKELLPQLLERARRLDREDVTKLADFCERHGIDNIEDLLTAAELATFSSRNPIILRLLNYLLYRNETDDSRLPVRYAVPWDMEQVEYIPPRQGSAADLASVAFLQDTLQVLFGLLSSTMIPAKPNAAHEAIAEYVKANPGSCIITTNYDCCMDLALGDVSKDFDYRIEFANLNVSNDGENENCTRLIKLHGSLNWFYCETCQEIQLIDIRQTVANFVSDKGLYPVIGICKDCGGQRRGLLVPPLAMKFDVAPPLTPLLSDAKSAFDRADLIVVVGFSFAEADVYISRMVSKSMQASPTQRMLIIDPDGGVVERVRRKYTASIPNFDSERIVKATGDCCEILPQFLGGVFQRKPEVSNAEAKQSRKRSRSKRASST